MQKVKVTLTDESAFIFEFEGVLEANEFCLRTRRLGFEKPTINGMDYYPVARVKIVERKSAS